MPVVKLKGKHDVNTISNNQLKCLSISSFFNYCVLYKLSYDQWTKTLHANALNTSIVSRNKSGSRDAGSFITRVDGIRFQLDEVNGRKHVTFHQHQPMRAPVCRQPRFKNRSVVNNDSQSSHLPVECKYCSLVCSGHM